MFVSLALFKKKYIEPHVLFLNFGDGSCVSCFICTYFLTLCALSFRFAYGFLWYAKGFKLNKAPFFFLNYSRRWTQQGATVIYVKDCSAYVLL